LLDGGNASGGGHIRETDKDLVAGTRIDEIQVVRMIGRGGKSFARRVLDDVKEPDLAGCR
jgi:hypothetical protein